MVFFLSLGATAWAKDPETKSTFEPGKKYVCVPTAGSKDWDCSESAGKTPSSTETSADAQTTVVRQTSAAEPRAPKSASSPPPAASAPPAAGSRSRALPAYLTNPDARSQPGEVTAAPTTTQPAVANPAAQPAASATARQTEQVESSAAASPATSPSPATVTSLPPEPAVVEASPSPAVEPTIDLPAPAAPTPPVESHVESHVEPRVESHAAASPAPRNPTTVSGEVLGAAGFLDLPGDRYVLELARGADASAVDLDIASLGIPTGNIYRLRLLQNGANWWLLVWAGFDSADAARAGRARLPASVSAGFPRRVGPLQAELRRATGG